MKRFLFWAVCLGFVACTDKRAERADGSVVASVGMIADVAREIAGDDLEVASLIGNGIDPHTFQPGKSDVEKIQKAGLVLYNGLYLEGKMGSVFENRRGKGHRIAAVAEGLEEVSLIGGENHPDPHLWMDVALWSKVAAGIAVELAAFAPDKAEAFQERLERYQEKLNALDQYARVAMASIPAERRILVTAHDAFSYLGRAYGIEVRGIQGISTESEAGTKDINDLVNLLVTRKVPAIFVESSVSDKSVRAVIEGAAQQGHTVTIGGKLYSDAMGNPGTYEGTYIGMIDHNVTTIVRALGGEAPATGFQDKLTR